MPEKLLTDKQWRAMHGWDELQAEVEKLNNYIQKRQSTSEYDEGRANADAALQAENKRLKKALEEIMLIQPRMCDGNHQGDYACDLHFKIAKQTIKDGKPE